MFIGMLNSLLLNMPIEIVDLPMKHGDFPSFFGCLPEGMFTKIPT